MVIRGAFVDPLCQINEWHEDNNKGLRTYTSTLPDLVITGMTVTPTAGAPGMAGTLSVTIKNIGSVTASGTAAFRLDSWFAFTGGSPSFGADGSVTSAFGSLAAGESMTTNYSFTFGATPGTVTAHAIVDSGSVVTEGNEGNNRGSVSYNVVRVDAKIFRADSDPAGDPFGALVNETDEETIGSFTVANLNDTNGNGVPDKDDNNLPGGIVASATGRNEMDLMRLILERPQPNSGGTVTLTIESGDIAVWGTFTKTSGSAVTRLSWALSEFTTDHHGGDGNPDMELWIEARSPSTNLRGISLKYTYTPPGSTTPLSDVVKATAVWATVTNVVTQNLTPAQVDLLLGPDWMANAGDPRNRIQAGDPIFGSNGTGVQPPGQPTRNVIVIEFRVTPNNISTVPIAHRPLFDITRQIYGTSFRWVATNATPAFIFAPDEHPHYPAQNEQANDDPVPEIDETDEPSAGVPGDSGGRIWVVDGPGGGGGALSVHRNNFREFLRVRFDWHNPTGDGNVVSGSRCSPKQEWYSKTTLGEATAPNEISTGNFVFQDEALSTGVLAATTTPGTRHHAHNKGLRVAAVAGAAAENVSVRLIEVDPLNNDLLDTPTSPVFGKLGGATPTQVGDQVAHTVVGYFASRLNGEVVGPSGSGGESSAELAHEFIDGGNNSTSVAVTGTAFTQPAPTVPPMVPGAITTVTITGFRAEADAAGGGLQTVNIRIIEADPLSDDLLHSVTVMIPRNMTDEAGATVDAIPMAAMDPANANGRIAAKADGKVIGPDGDGNEQSAEIAFEFSSGGNNSPETPVSGPVYTLGAPIIAVNPIPVGATSTVTIQNIYTEATGTTGNEVFQVQIVDDDSPFSDDVLENITVTIARPAGCFPGALIGPVTTTGTLLNLSGGEVRGPAGGSGESTAEIQWRHVPLNRDSPIVLVTAL